MVTAPANADCAESYEELAPLVELCKAGRLFDVQSWIQQGQPVNPPPASNKRRRKKSPLEYAISLGFHSLVEILLQGGASVERDGNFCPMELALDNRRFDLVQLLVDHGYDPMSVDMQAVFSTWDPEIMEFFIQRAADMESEMPLAWALCNRIGTALGVFKKYRHRFPSFQDQANVALRHHCKEGNMKWVSLMIWAGADPLAPGESEPDVADPDTSGLSALAYAALYGHYEVFSLKQVKLPVDQQISHDILEYCCEGKGLSIAEELLKKGLDPNDRDNGGSTTIQRLLERLEWSGRFHLRGWERHANGIDTDQGRDNIKAMHLLVKHGGRWCPTDSNEINAARRSLLKMTPDYTIEFVWIMAKYQACSLADIEALLRTPTIKRHTAAHRHRLSELRSEWFSTPGQ